MKYAAESLYVQPATPKRLRTAILRESAELDLLMLSVDSRTASARFSEPPPAEGDAVFALFPPENGSQFVTGPIFYVDPKLRIIVARMSIPPRAIGAPVFDRRGGVIGMTKERFSEPDNDTGERAIMVPAQSIQRFIDEWRKGNEDSSSDAFPA